MRIALVAYACDPAAGTEPGFGWQWTRHLLQHGHDVDVLTRDDPGRLDRLHRALAELAAPGTCRVRPIPHRAPGPASSRWQEWRAYTGWLDSVSRQIGEIEVDLVHHVTYGSLKGGSVRTDRPLVFGPIGGGESVPAVLLPALGPRGAAVEGLRGAVDAVSRRSRRTVKAADLVLATNKATLRAASTRGARRTELMLADGLPDEYLVREPSTRDLSAPVVLWAGSLQPRKGPLLALRAFARMRAEVPRARMRMLGDGPMRETVRAERDKLGLAGAVELAGRVPWNDMVREYDQAAVFLFSSIRDAFGAQCLEAWARGTPSVGLDLFGLADHAPEKGCELVPAGRPIGVVDGLAEAVLRTLEPATHGVRQAAAVAAAREHTWTSKVDRAEARYRELVGGTP